MAVADNDGSSTPTASNAGTGTSRSREPVDAVPLRHYGQWLFAAVVLYLLTAALLSLARNPNMDWGTIGKYLLSDLVIEGVANTLLLTAIGMVLGVAGGLVLAIMRLSENFVLKYVAFGYVWFMRSIPLLVLIVIFGFLGALYPKIAFGIPLTPLVFYEGDSNVLISAFTGAILALGLNEMAFTAEIARAGILSVDSGQSEAARALGMGFPMRMRLVVLPQAMRVIVPPMGNETIQMLKSTSLVAIIGGGELFTVVQQIYSQNFRPIPLMVVATLWYLLLVTILSIGQARIEKRVGRGFVPRKRRGSGVVSCSPDS